jgi:hypothetical protein
MTVRYSFTRAKLERERERSKENSRGERDREGGNVKEERGTDENIEEGSDYLVNE